MSPAVVLALWMLLVAACAPSGEAPTATAEATGGRITPGTASPGTASPGVVIEHLTAQRPGVSVELAYPQLRGVAPPEVADRINETLRAWAEERRGAFLDEVGEALGDETRPRPGLAVTSRIRDRFVGSGVVSLVLEEERYLGGAHSSLLAHGFTFELATGRRLSLRDLLRPGATEELVARVVDRLATREGPWARSELAAAVTPETMDAFLVSSRGLTVLFDPYVVAPGALGIVPVELGPDRLEGLVRPDGPLAAPGGDGDAG